VSTFDRCFLFVVGEEGGYVNNPADPGGDTKYGISKRQYPTLDIKSLTLDQAKAIYLRDYWTPMALDGVKYGPALVLFDCAVNQGVARAQEFFRQTAVSSAAFIVAFQAARMMHYASLPTWATFGKGWTRRLLRTAIEASKDA